MTILLDRTCRGCYDRFTPGNYNQAFCNTCRHDSDFSAYRQAEHKFKITMYEWKHYRSIEFCQICDTKLDDGGGPGVSKHNQRQIDHCHHTGKIRGVLCWNCNSALGKLGDDIRGLEAALKYLKGNE